jgi:hypothetical protein
MEELTSLVSSRGLRKSCGAHNRQSVSSSPAIDADLLAAHRPGGSIYLCTDAVPEFAKNWLPRLGVPFTLVSGDSDVPVGPASLGSEVLAAILESELCQSWFAQNKATQHAKLHALPIGLDYHTMSENPGLWGLAAVSPVAQEHQLLATWAQSPEPQRRYMAAYCNWCGTLERGDRRACFETMDRSVCFMEKAHIPRASSWARQAEFLFVVSPEGAGMDCHRTWEALLLGCIPIVKRNSISELLERLPVLIVEDWAQVRRETLESGLNELTRRTFDFSSLFRESWLRRIHGLPASRPLESTWMDFRRTMTRVTG